MPEEHNSEPNQDDTSEAYRATPLPTDTDALPLEANRGADNVADSSVKEASSAGVSSTQTVAALAAAGPPPTDAPLKPPKKVRFASKIVWLAIFIVILGLASTAAYMVGKHHERVIVQAPPVQPINLPPQATVLSQCVAGRGKQYIIPKDIPTGPIYDVVNSKVIAIEYNLNLNDLESNPDTFSSTILKLTKDYPVNHFSIVPVVPQSGASLQNIHLIMFVVSKAVSASITCGTPKSS